MIHTEHIQPEDLALYAMRLLPANEAAQVHAHIQQCAECLKELQQAQSDLAIVALTVELEAHRPQARQRFLDQVAREKRVIPIDRAANVPVHESSVPKPRRGAGGALLPWLGWALAAGVTFFAVSQHRERSLMQNTIADQATQLQAETTQLASLSAEAIKSRALMEALTDTSAMRVTLNTTPAAKPSPQGRANYVPSKGTLVFIANNLEPAPLDKVYELWIIPADGSGPVPAGTFHPDARGNASVILPNIPKGVPAKAFGVTLEAEGGSTKPTLPILMVGQ